jgi:hypothetical protein
MTHDERLIGRRPSDQHVQESRARLDAMFDRRFEQRDALRTERRSLDNASLKVLRGLAGEDPILSSAVKRSQARSAALAKRPLRRPEGTKVRARARLGSISVTFVPPFWPWQWSASTGSATADVGADGDAGTMNFDAWTGDNGKNASTAVALGYYFQPLADSGIMDVFASPSFNYVWDSDNVFDNRRVHRTLCWSVHAGRRIRASRDRSANQPVEFRRRLRPRQQLRLSVVRIDPCR